MAELAGRLPLERRHAQAVVVDEAQGQLAVARAGDEQDVAVLQIAVGHADLAQLVGEAYPQVRQHPLSTQRMPCHLVRSARRKALRRSDGAVVMTNNQ